jgi:hypothetical protein
MGDVTHDLQGCTRSHEQTRRPSKPATASSKHWDTHPKPQNFLKEMCDVAVTLDYNSTHPEDEHRRWYASLKVNNAKLLQV